MTATTTPAARTPIGAADAKAAADLLDSRVRAESQPGTARIAYDADGAVTWLFLHHSSATDENVRLAAMLPTLRTLKICCVNADRPLTAGAFASLASLPHLEEVDLLATGAFTPDLAKAVGGVQSIERLSIRGNDVTRAALAELSGLRRVRALRIADTDVLVDVAWASELSRFEGLEQLDVSGTRASAAAVLAVAARLPQLSRLTVTGTGISREQVRTAGLPKKVVVIGATP